MPPPIARQVGPHLPQPRQGIFQLGQLDLQRWPRRCGPGVAKMSRISSLRSSTLTFGGLFQVADLAGRQVVVEDDHVGIGGLDLLEQFVHLALADVACRASICCALLGELADDDGPGGRGQAAQLFERIRRRETAGRAGPRSQEWPAPDAPSVHRVWCQVPRGWSSSFYTTF